MPNAACARGRPPDTDMDMDRVEVPAGHHGELPAPTVPEPFRLATEQRGTAHRSAMAARLAVEEEATKRARVREALAAFAPGGLSLRGCTDGVVPGGLLLLLRMMGVCG